MYRWSRNSQFFGWYLAIVGYITMGVSGYVLLATILTIILSHYYIVRFEELFLERVFGEEYLRYKLRTPRYVGEAKKSTIKPISMSYLEC